LFHSGWVYGRRLGQHKQIFTTAAKENVTIAGKISLALSLSPLLSHSLCSLLPPSSIFFLTLLLGVHKDRRYSWVHVDDLGESYVLAAKAGKRVAGEVFNIVGYLNK
jgi:hypothetical protein